MRQLTHFTPATLLFVVASCSAPTSDPVEALIKEITETRGGARAIERIETIRTRVRIAEPGFTVVGDYRATRSGLMRIDIYMGEQLVYSEGIDERGAWERNGGMSESAIEVSGAPEAALAHGMEFNLYGLHEYEARGHDIIIDGEEDIDGTLYTVLRIRLEDGFETFFYVNPETRRTERRRDIRALHPTSDPEKRLLEMVYTGFEEACGIRDVSRSFQRDVLSGERVQETQRLSQECNLQEDALNLDRSAPPLPQ